MRRTIHRGGVAALDSPTQRFSGGAQGVFRVARGKAAGHQSWALRLSDSLRRACIRSASTAVFAAAYSRSHLLAFDSSPALSQSTGGPSLGQSVALIAFPLIVAWIGL